MGIRTKFNLVMLAGFLVGLVLAALLARDILQASARREVLQDARIMLEEASAIRGYTDHEIAPLLADQSRIRFLPHTVPSWAAQTNFRAIATDFPNYSYKEPTLNPTNPADRPTDWEADIINGFRQNPAEKELVLERDTPNGPTLNLAHPLTVADPGCLTCHSVPAAAPASMIDLYGSGNGFGWKLHDVIGAQLVTVPMSVALDTANRVLLLFLAALALVFLVMVVVLNVLLHRFIVQPVKAISRFADEVSMGNLETPEYAVHGRDEIASLATSFNRMRRSVVNAMKMLEAD